MQERMSRDGSQRWDGSYQFGFGVSVLLALSLAVLVAGCDFAPAEPGFGSFPPTPTMVPFPTFPPTPTMPDFNIFGPPLSVAAFCPTPAQLQPIVNDSSTPDFQTGTQQSTTMCGYQGSTSSGGLFIVTAWGDATVARQQFESQKTGHGSSVQPLSGYGDEAYFDGDAVNVLKGNYTFNDKWYYRPPLPIDSERVDEQIAHLLLARL